MQNVITFLFKKIHDDGRTSISKTKIFISVEAVLRAIEFLSPYYGMEFKFPEPIHQSLYALAGLSYAERAK